MHRSASALIPKIRCMFNGVCVEGGGVHAVRGRRAGGAVAHADTFNIFLSHSDFFNVASLTVLAYMCSL